MNEPDDTIVEVNEIDLLDAAWDDWNVTKPTSVGKARQFDTLFTALESADQRSDPDRMFLADLRSQLVESRTIMTSTLVPKSSLGLVAFPQRTLIFPRSNAIRGLVAAAAVVLLIAALFGGSHWIPGSDSARLVASAMASPMTQEVATSTTYPVSSSYSEVHDAARVDSTQTQWELQPTAIAYVTVPIQYETSGDHHRGAVRTQAVVYSRE